MLSKSTTPRLQFVRVCACGCGQPTLLATKTDRVLGWVLGQPLTYLNRHQTKHPRKVTRHMGDPPLADYYIDPNGCWVWQRSRTPKGYGRLTVNYRSTYAHRVYYERAYGPIPEGLHLDHLCHNPACVNPEHLEPVTPAENTRRNLRRRYGHPAPAA